MYGVPAPSFSLDETRNAIYQNTIKNADKAFDELDTPQCGYCIPGMIMSAAALLNSNPNPNDQAIDTGITNICRCGTYVRIRKAIHRAAELTSKDA